LEILTTTWGIKQFWIKLGNKVATI